jgi:hypothetical protein
MIRVVAVGASVGVFLAGVGAAALILGHKALQELDDARIWEMSD